MKKHLIYLLIAAILASFLAGCAPAEEASGTVPWGSPAKFEGAGVGLQQLDKQE
jgi:hypothetical protein